MLNVRENTEDILEDRSITESPKFRSAIQEAVRAEIAKAELDLDPMREGHDLTMEYADEPVSGSSFAEDEAKQIAAHEKEINSAWNTAKVKKIGTEATLNDAFSMYRKQHYIRPRPNRISLYCSVLGCTPKNMVNMSQVYPSLLSQLIRYALFKSLNDPKSIFNMSEIETKIGGETFTIPSGLNNLERIHISLTKTVEVPAKFHVLIKGKKENEKLVIFGENTYSGFAIEAYGASREIVTKFFDWLSEQKKNHNFLKGANIDAKANFIDVEKVKKSDIVLRPGIWDKIERNIVDIFEKEHIFTANGIQAKRGFALVGPPGTGKTTIFKILASELKDVTCILVTPSQLGYGAESIAKIYDLANELAPSLVFLEDADIWAQKRQYESSSGGMLTELMNRLDGVVPLKGVVTGLSSNRPEVLEGALINRPGRFDIRIYLGPPDLAGRFEILRRRFEKVKIDPQIVKDFVDTDKLDKFSPAMLGEIAKRAIIIAIEENRYNKSTLIATIEKADLESALSSMVSEMDANGNYLDDHTMYKETFGLSWDGETITESSDQQSQIINESTRANKAEDFLQALSTKNEAANASEEDVKNLIKVQSGVEKIRWYWGIGRSPVIGRAVKELLTTSKRLLLRNGVKRDTIPTAMKLLDDDKATLQDIINVLTGGG